MNILKNAILLSLMIIIIFFLLLISIAKPGYIVYAYFFQNGVLYQGETKTEYFLDYLCYVIFPLSIFMSIGLFFLAKKHK